MQNTSTLLMIRPVMFGFNAETAINNAFQMQGYDTGAQARAVAEFDNFVRKLELYGIDITVIQDTPKPHTPDSIFPNNWISFHSGGTICLYPMFAQNRRVERNPAVIAELSARFVITKTIDFTAYENSGKFLEGTGSMVLDRANKLAFACLSERTNRDVFADFCQQLGYTGVPFNAADAQSNAIYHTNVMLCIAQQYAVICAESIHDTAQRQQVLSALTQAGKEIIEISFEQMAHFAGNMLQVKNTAGEQFLVMSSSAFRALERQQIAKLRQYNTIIDSELETIEKNGGGSARCMLAEVFLEKV